MKLSIFSKVLPVIIFGTVIFAIAHIIYTIKNYPNILTALPLWMSVVFELVLWIVVLLIEIAIYIVILKHLNK